MENEQSMGNEESAIHPSLQEKLGGLGVRIVGDWKALGSQKLIAEAKMKHKDDGGEENVLVMRSRTSSSWHFDRELEVLRDLRGRGAHPHIIEMLDFIHADEDHGPCMVTEVGENFGFDLWKFVAVTAKENHQVQFEEIASTMLQLLKAIGHLHGKGWVHCDLKVEQVVVNKHVVKLIDFGYARRLGVEHVAAVGYGAPETACGTALALPPVDCFGLGLILWYLSFKERAPMPRRRDEFEAEVHRANEKDEKDPRVRDALFRLLAWEPDQRMTLDELRSIELLQLAQETDTVSQARRDWTKPPGVNELVWRSPVRTTEENWVWGLKIVAGSPHIGHYIGPWNERSPPSRKKNSPKLDLGGHGVSVLSIERKGEVGLCPTKDDQLQEGDWLYFTKNGERLDAKKLPDFDVDTSKILGPATSTGASHLTRFYPDFDEFKFPPGCVGKMLRELDLRTFSINLAGIWRRKLEGNMVVREMLFGAAGALRADTVILEGDVGLVMRPRLEGAAMTRYALKDAQVQMLMDAFPEAGGTAHAPERVRDLAFPEAERMEVRLWETEEENKRLRQETVTAARMAEEEAARRAVEEAALRRENERLRQEAEEATRRAGQEAEEATRRAEQEEAALRRENERLRQEAEEATRRAGQEAEEATRRAEQMRREIERLRNGGRRGTPAVEATRSAGSVRRLRRRTAPAAPDSQIVMGNRETVKLLFLLRTGR